MSDLVVTIVGIRREIQLVETLPDISGGRIYQDLRHFLKYAGKTVGSEFRVAV